MKLRLFGVFSLIGVSFTGACHKTAPVAARTPEPVQVAAAPKTSVASPSSGAAALASRPVNQNLRSGMSSQERKVLNDRLAHLADALFDYDKSSIRTDAANALQDDVGVIAPSWRITPLRSCVLNAIATSAARTNITWRWATSAPAR